MLLLLRLMTVLLLRLVRRREFLLLRLMAVLLLRLIITTVITRFCLVMSRRRFHIDLWYETPDPPPACQTRTLEIEF